jgi:hypothetical protein
VMDYRDVARSVIEKASKSQQPAREHTSESAGRLCSEARG